MKDLKLMFERAKEDLDVIGIQYGNIVEIKVNTRAKSRWGQCCTVLNSQYWENKQFSINISDRLLQDDVTDEACLDTIIHEILHTCKGCMNHGREWKELAELVNDCYACYNIKRCTSSSEKGIDNIDNTDKVHKYAVKCTHCGKVWYKDRMCGVVKNPKGYTHKCSDGCKGDIVRVW